MAKVKTVDQYVEGLDGWQAKVAASLREIVSEAAPEAEEAIKWSQPVYSLKGPFAYIKAHTNHVNFGFWRGADLEDPDGLLEGEGEKMRHIKLTDPNDIKPEAFKALVREAAALNQRE